MARIYTKTGDKGKTSLYGGKRLSKAHIRIEAYGTVDELNSHIGLLRVQPAMADLKAKDTLKNVQMRLFSIGSSLASDPERKPLPPDIRDEDITELETAIDEMQAELPALKHFILPGGNQAAAIAHVCRTVCRRAERRIVALNDEAEVESEIIGYINRLSDYFFVVSRYLVLKSGDEENIWLARSV